jgi:hypothetical protein
MSKKKENRFENIEEEVGFLRRQNAGMRGRISLLQKEVMKYKELDLEGERLKKELSNARSVKENTVPFAKFAELEQSIDTKNAFIESLQERVQTLMLEKSNLKDEVASLTEEQVELNNTIDDLRTPWYKKLLK